MNASIAQPEIDWTACAELFRLQQWQLAQQLLATAVVLLREIRAAPKRAKGSLLSRANQMAQLASKLGRQATGLDAKAAKPAAPTGPPPLSPEAQADVDAVYAHSKHATNYRPPAAAPNPPPTPSPQPPSSGCAGDSAANPKKDSPPANTPEAAGTAFNSQFAPHPPATAQPQPQPAPQSKIETQNSKIPPSPSPSPQPSTFNPQPSPHPPTTARPEPQPALQSKIEPQKSKTPPPSIPNPTNTHHMDFIHRAMLERIHRAQKNRRAH